MARDPRQQAKGRRTSGTFLALPHALLNSTAWRGLGPSATKLAIDMASKLNGKNNGAITCTLSAMRKRGWKSSSTLAAAKAELIEAGIIEQTRQGGLFSGHRVPSMYAVTWLPIDRIENQAGQHVLEIQPTKVASGAWKN